MPKKRSGGFDPLTPHRGHCPLDPYWGSAPDPVSLRRLGAAAPRPLTILPSRTRHIRLVTVTVAQIRLPQTLSLAARVERREKIILRYCSFADFFRRPSAPTPRSSTITVGDRESFHHGPSLHTNVSVFDFQYLVTLVSPVLW